MTGIWALLRKEALEQRRSRKFLAMLALLLAAGILPVGIAFIVFEVTGEPRTVEEAPDALTTFVGIVGFALGPLLAILVMMGSIADERNSGTAAMTLHKPVTRLAFVTAKLTGFAVTMTLAIALSAAIFYLLTLLVFGDGGITSFAAAAGILAGYSIFLGSLAFFWSSLLRSAVAAGGTALFIWITLQIVLGVPHAGRYLPTSAPLWAMSLLGAEESDSGDRWPAFLVALVCIAVLSAGSWAIFQRKEL